MKKTLFEMTWTTLSKKLKSMWELFNSANGGKYRQWLANVRISTYCLKLTMVYIDTMLWQQISRVIHNVLKRARLLPVTILVDVTYKRLKIYFVYRMVQYENQVAMGNDFLKKWDNYWQPPRRLLSLWKKILTRMGNKTE